MRPLSFFAIALLTSLVISPMNSQGKVYIVLGSDTGIWDGMGTATYHDNYALDLFTSPLQNAATVMAPSFRAPMVDSYGQPMKMTWWMMSGNIFRYATNTNIPVPNIMTLYLMKKYYGADALANGDEITLHYHTFSWYDYNGDGKAYWNQAQSFLDCKSDFDVTLAQFLLEENTFPVSFRSGWHYMDNDWQHYLNTILPYSLHDDYPAVRKDTVEPIDNDYDWSHSSSDFVPFRPSDADYQVGGGTGGWDTRSKYMGSVSQAMMDGIFSQAAAGKDQVPCFWAHLPETDFPFNMHRIDSLAHISASKYPTVKFKYCTAVEAMQLWRGGTDTTAPQLTVTPSVSGDQLTLTITTNEPTFQEKPFVAAKDIYEEYTLVPCTKTGPTSWETAPVTKSTLAKIGVAVTDTMGNLSTRIVRLLPDDLYLDNLDPQYAEVSGSWAPATTPSWGTDARVAQLSGTDTARARWSFTVPQRTAYNIFLQVPSVGTPADSVVVRIRTADSTLYEAALTHAIAANQWVPICTLTLPADTALQVDVAAGGASQAGKQLAADVLRISALVRARELVVVDDPLDLGSVKQDDTLHTVIRLLNRGSGNLTVTGLTDHTGHLTAAGTFPLIVAPNGSADLPVLYRQSELGEIIDTAYVASDDPRHPLWTIAVSGSVVPYYEVVDNDDSASYSETGTWNKSVAQAYRSSSRYAWLTTVGAKATFHFVLEKTGEFEVSEIVPTTVNAANSALYVIETAGLVDSVYQDQNAGSGGWVALFRHWLTANVPVTVSVINNGRSTAGAVLRADAIRLALLPEITAVPPADGTPIPTQFVLQPNYPNPFNPSTKITYAVPSPRPVRLSVIDLLGREVRILVDERQAAGWHTVTFDASALSSGMYLLRIQAGPEVRTQKMLLLK